MISAMSMRMTTPNNTPIQVMQYVLFETQRTPQKVRFFNTKLY